MEKNKDAVKLVAKNKKAYHDYFIEQTYEAGVQLFGTEVKSVRAGSVNMKDSYCAFSEGEIFAKGVHISPFEKGNIFNRDPLRDKKLLMHKKEIMRIFGLVGKQGYAVIPLSVYFKGSHVKMEIGLCRGKKLYDKRESEAKRDAERTIDRAMRERNKD